MTVTFSSVADFLGELHSELKEAPERVDDGIVRACIERRNPNVTTTHVALIAGFCSLGELRQLQLSGVDFKGKEQESSVRAEEGLRAIEQFANENGLKFRGGRHEGD